MILIKFLCAIITRSLFLLFSLIGVWRVTWVKNNNLYWFLTILFLPLVFEMIITTKMRKGNDYRWFSPAILLFLISIIPSLWLLELHQRTDISNASQCNRLDSLLKNITNMTQRNEISRDYGRLLTTVCPNDWILTLHQILLILLIVGKWLLPLESGITRDELSQLLLVFVGTAADILEFNSETLSDVKENSPHLVYIILGVWTWSMIQFPLHLSVVNTNREDSSEGKADTFLQRNQMDLWNIVESLLIQDGPFLVVRSTVMVHFKVVHQMLVFFTIKNFLVVILNIYRLFVIYQSQVRNQVSE